MSQYKKYVSPSKLEAYHGKAKAIFEAADANVLSQAKSYVDAELEEFSGQVNEAIDVLSGEIDSKANATHKHNISDINNLQGQLDSKAGKDEVGIFRVIVTGNPENAIFDKTYEEVANAINEEKTVYAALLVDNYLMYLPFVGVMSEGIYFALQLGTEGFIAVYGQDGNGFYEIFELDAEDFGADPVGSAGQALSDAKEYTDDSIDTLSQGFEEIVLPMYEAYQQLPDTFALKTHNHEISQVSGLQSKLDSLTDHTNNKSNPHGVTAVQVGADPAGSASAVQGNLDTVEDKVDDHIAATELHFTQAERNKLSGIEANANKYTHPSSGVSAGTYRSVTVNAQGHVTAGSNPTTLAGYGITDAEAKGTVNTHNASTTAHSDIRDSLTALSNQLNAFLDVDDATRDELSEVLALIDANKGTLESLTTSKVNVADIINNLTTNVSNKPLSAAQGVSLKSLIDGLDSNKVDKVSGKGLSTNDYTTEEKTKLSGIATGAEVNQNAFSNVIVGSTTIAADSKTDSLTLVGSNVTITPDATNDKLTFSVADGTTSAKGLVKLTDSTSSTDTTTAATPKSVKSAYDLANTAKTNAGNAQTKADSAYDLATAASNFINAITATTTELNYVDGVTSNIQTQLNGKASTSVATTSANGLMSSSDKSKLNGIAEGANNYELPVAGSTVLGGVKIGSNISISDGKISVPVASGSAAGVTIVYPAASCTTFSSDSGTVTPLAVQKGAKMFAITRPSSTTDKAITRYSNTTGDVQDSKILIEDVTNSKDSSKKAQVISIPAEGGKKMVYGYCTDQVDGTSFIGGVFDANATSFPYAEGLAIGGTSGNLLWKGAKVAVSTDIPTKVSQLTNDSGFKSTNATTSASGLMSATDKTKLDATNMAYGTCSTAADTAAKVVTVSGNTNWSLTAGSFITVLFNATNTAENPTLNVNGTGAKNIYYGASQITTSSLSYGGYANRPMTFVYDGTQYRFAGWGYDSNTTYTNVKLGHGYATCSTAEATVAKVGTLSSYTLTTGGIVAVKFTNAVPASATLNINSKGAKAIYYRGAAITAGVIKAGDTATFIYNGSQYHLISIDSVSSGSSGGGFDFDALINASGYSYTYVKSTGVETIKQGSTTYATRTSTKNASTGVWTVVTVCSAAGVNVTKTYTPSSTGWTVA